MKKRKQALLSIILVLLYAVLSVLTVFAAQDGPDVYADGYCVMDRVTGEIIFQKNMDEKYFPASITKIMTALVVAEHCDDLKEELTFSDEAVNSLTANSSTLTPKAAVGEKMSVEDALYGMMLCSANECGNALAEHVAGSVEEFADLMNEKAAQVGAVNTHFANPHGLHDEEHYTTPHDMALIFQAALENEVFAQIDMTVKYKIPKTNKNEERDCTMTHRLLNGAIECQGAYAGKTGNTAEAGRTLVTAVKRHGYDLIIVIMKSDEEHFYSDTQVLMEYGFGKVTGSYPGLVYEPKDDYVYASGSLRVREFASVFSRHMYSAEEGQEMHRTGTYAGWSKVEIADGAYYVSTDFLTDANKETIAAPYETLEPSEAEYETNEPSGTQAAAAKPSASNAGQSQEASTKEEMPEGKPDNSSAYSAGTTAAQRPGKAAVYEIDENVLVVIIVAIIMAIAVIAGIIVAILIIRRA